MSDIVYHGPWINWAHGPVAGATLTLGEREGGLLIAFIAFFVTLVAGYLFKIITYIIHQARSRDSAQDGLYHQQQIIFRNSITPSAAAWNFIQQAWTWQSKARMSLFRTLPWALFCIFYMTIFALAAIFSSRITESAGSARLVTGNGCGYWDTVADYSSAAAIKAFSGRVSNQTLANAAYARECYGGTPNHLACSKMTKEFLDTTTNVNASCPFAEGMCQRGDNAAFEIMSERIDSLYDLGINSRHSDRLHFQKAATCSPIFTRDFIEAAPGGRSSGKGIVGDGIYTYMFGPYTYVGGNINFTDYTYVFNNHSLLDGLGYSLSSEFHNAGTLPESGGWQPIAELNRTDADVNIMFLSQHSISYADPVDDPLFSAHIPLGFGQVSDLTYYNADYYVTAMACIDQYQICNPNTQKCTGLMGVNQILPWIVMNNDKLELNTVQQAISIRMMRHAFESSIHQTVFAQGENGLLAQESLVGQLSQPLPNNQWQLEVENFFHKGLAHIQLATVEYAVGPPIGPGAVLSQPWKENTTLSGASLLDLVAEAMCYSQLINETSDSVSFSILGMAILFIFGAIIIIVSTFVDTVVGWTQRRFNIGAHARMCWLLDDKLQLHRSLNQELGQGQWSDDHEVMPSTVSPQQFYTLAVAQQKGQGNEKTQKSPTWAQQEPVEPATSAYQGVSHPGGGHAPVGTSTEELWLGT